MTMLERRLEALYPGVQLLERLQTLWGGWGEVVRVRLPDGSPAVVKHVLAPAGEAGTSAARKRRSYDVEEHFYRSYAGLPGVPRVATPLHLEPGLFVLEDLDAAGFVGRAEGTGSLPPERIEEVLHWLADLHGALLGHPAPELWPRGTYWHLATRPDELAAMAPGPLKDAAEAIDVHLAAARFPTVLHGDAKVANGCFGEGVAMVDFQYAGRGPGVCDVAYFLGSTLDDRALMRDADAWLGTYTGHLLRHVDGHERADVRDEIHALWPFAWADFERFLAGWSPGHWKRGGYAQRQADRALEAL